MFTERRTAYQNFASLANQLPAVFVPDEGIMNQSSFLMPGIPMSDGILPTVKQELGEVNGTSALLTDLKEGDRTRHAKLRLYTAMQTFEYEMPRVRFSMREISWWDMAVVDGRLALVGDEFADEMKGWALVKVIDDRCSPQTIVTRCTVYQQYTTEDALEKAADSYGGLTETPFLSPR
jgi:membrane protease subunit (stomatin/prohibitin family)